ncbi:MAG: helical backbone metal receptor [Saprospiraceae bacterium]|nr:helical backbone metal receptor [Saprospiraceae bacterium]MDW8483859.1 helical backbone metal receptor [Saprospiraceae bacterium]
MPLLPTPALAPERPPQRIVSLVPSQTELLWSLGLEQEVVGITKFCVRPEAWFRQKTRVGGTKTIHLDRVHTLQPDLILANYEENVREQVEALAEHYPVWVSNVNDLPSGLAMIAQVGILTHREVEAKTLIERIESAFASLSADLGWRPRRAAYFIWRKPWMVAGSDTFIHAMLTAAGFDNVFASARRYPEVHLVDLPRYDPEVLLLSSEPYPFSQKHFAEFQEACSHAQILLVDGQMFSWYGSRLLEAPAYFKQLRMNLSRNKGNAINLAK